MLARLGAQCLAQRAFRAVQLLMHNWRSMQAPRKHPYGGLGGGVPAPVGACPNPANTVFELRGGFLMSLMVSLLSSGMKSTF